MTRKIAYQKSAETSKTQRVPFYGAIKSDNELYFQMASLFQEATKGKKQLSGQLLQKMLKSKQAKSPGIMPVFDL